MTQARSSQSEFLVLPFSPEVCSFSNREHTWREFHKFRNSVLDVLTRYGTVGPMGKMPILASYEESSDAWRSATKNCDFFVVDDDMYGLSVRIEANSVFAKPVLFEELAMLLTQFNEWCVYFALVKGGLWVFHDRLLCEGDFFSECNSVAEVYDRCALGGEVDMRLR